MHTIHVKCPHCKAEYDVAAEKETVFCMECGTSINVTEHSKKEYTYNHNENINKSINVDKKQTYREVDDARIREAEVLETIRLKEIELELEKEKRKSKNERTVNTIGLVIALLLFGPIALMILREVLWW